MTWAGVRIGVGTRVMYDGEVYVLTEWLPTLEGADVVLRGPTSVYQVSVVELVSGRRARLLTDSEGLDQTTTSIRRRWCWEACQRASATS